MFPFAVTWNVSEYCGGSDCVGPGIPIPCGVSGVKKAVGDGVAMDVGRGVACGSVGACVHPAAAMRAARISMHATVISFIDEYQEHRS